jgi:transcriptional regulator with XRE-family HTH domain
MRNDEVAHIFGRNLKRCRRLMHMSQDELASRAGLHRTEVSMLERSIREPRLSTLVKLLASLEARPEELLRDIEWLPGSVRHGTFRVEAPPEPGE